MMINYMLSKFYNGPLYTNTLVHWPLMAGLLHLVQ